MTGHRLFAEPQVDLDVAAAFAWYENEQAGLGLDFLNELRATYDRIADGPFKYQDLRSGIRRALVRRFPYAGEMAAVGLTTAPRDALLSSIPQRAGQRTATSGTLKDNLSSDKGGIHGRRRD